METTETIEMVDTMETMETKQQTEPIVPTMADLPALPRPASPGPGPFCSSRWLRRFLARQDGGALVEMAITLPVLLAILTAIFSFGVAFNNQLVLTQAVGTGAQYLQQIRTNTIDPCADTINAISQAAPTLKKASISLSLTMNGSTVTGSSCSGSQSNLIQTQPVTVAATYPCNLMIYGTKFTGTCNLGAQVTEYEY